MPRASFGDSVDEVVEKVHERTNYEAIQSFMEKHDWKWYSEGMEVPSEGAIKHKVEEFVRRIIQKDFNRIYSGGILVLDHSSEENDYPYSVEVIFNIAGWF